MPEPETDARIAALEEARARIESVLSADAGWRALRTAAAGPDRQAAETALAADPLCRSWQLLNEAIAGLRARVGRQPAGEPDAPPDDLTRIRGVGRDLARRLAELGITRYAQITAWGPGDVRTVAAALGLGRQISRQNWIEQAALLATSRPPAHAQPPTQTARPSAEGAASIGLDDILAQLRSNPALRSDPPPAAPDAPVPPADQELDQAPDGQQEPDVAEADEGAEAPEDDGASLPDPEEASVTFVIREADHDAYVDYTSAPPEPPRFGGTATARAGQPPWYAPPVPEAEEAEVVIVSRTPDRSRPTARRSGKPGGN